MNINLSWSAFKDIVDSKRLFMHYIDESDHYYVHAIDGSMSYTSIIVKDAASQHIAGLDATAEQANQTDFETNYKADANRPQTVAESATVSDFNGKQIVIPSGVLPSGYCEWDYDDTVYINKVLPIPVNAEWGDKIEFTVHLKSNDYPVGGYAQDIYLYENNPRNVWFAGNGGGKIPSYCKVRCTYIKGDDTTDAERKFIVIAEFLT